MSKYRKHLKGDPIPWLLSSNPWTRYNTLTHLLDKPVSSPEVQEAKKELLQHPFIMNLIKEAQNWLPKVATRNNDPELSYFQLRMLADFGLDANDPGMDQIIRKAIANKREGMFAARGEIPDKRTSAEERAASDPYANIWNVSPCNSPIIIYTLLSLNYRNEEVLKAVEALRDKWDTPQGWFCHFFFVDGQFKKLNAGCPMAGIMALEVFSQIPELKESIYAKNAFEPIRFHRDYGKTLYYFGRSKKFRTLKYPFVWYNALYLADVLTRFDFLKNNELARELVEWIEQSQDDTGRFKPTSVFLPYREWDFGSKREQSPWITYLCCRILKQWYE